jgi:hypothetical protein
MIKWLICRLWGHQTMAKAYTGETYQVTSYAGIQHTSALYRWERQRFCCRCGRDNYPPAEIT